MGFMLKRVGHYPESGESLVIFNVVKCYEHWII